MSVDGQQCMVPRPRRLPMNHSSQIRMTNDEIRRNDKIRMTKPANAPLRVIRHSGFGFHSSFVTQRLVRVRFMVPMHAQKRMAAIHEPWLVWSPAFRRLEGLGPAEAGTPSSQRF